MSSDHSRVAFIAGARPGIGRATAVRLASRGQRWPSSTSGSTRRRRGAHAMTPGVAGLDGFGTVGGHPVDVTVRPAYVDVIRAR